MLALAVLTALATATSPDGLRTLTAVPTDATEQVCIDGRLDEGAWARAPVATGFRQREPAEGVPATEDTEVRVLFDRTSLYVGVLARDAEPARIIGRVLQRDRIMEAGGFDGAVRFAGDDGVAILLDPFHDRRNAIVFATNPNGAEFDALVTDENPAMNIDWRTVWTVRAVRSDHGWSAEFGVPFRSLRYPKDSREPWGFNVCRMVRRKNEQTLWSGWTREGGGLHRVSLAGVLEGLTGLPRSGLSLEAKPFGLGGAVSDRADEAAPLATEARADLGFDAKWEVRPGLVLDATVNPDFAQVEADEETVNLTRFDLYFPEKREFFLENAGIFELGCRGLGEPPPFLMFFSRTIGLAEDGEVPVLGGVRLSGRAGKQTVGLLDMVTGPAFGEGHVNYAVARLKRDLGRNGYLGAMVTDRRSATQSNTALGVDGSFWPSSSLNLQAFAARTLTSGAGGEGNAFRLGADMSKSRWGFLSQLLVVEPGVQAEMGFVTRTDIRRGDAYVRGTLRPRAAGLRRVDVFFGGQYVTRTDGTPQDGNLGPFVEAEWNSGETIAVFSARGFTRFDEGFELSDRIPVPPGDYDVHMTGFFARTGKQRALGLGLSGEHARIYGGQIDSIGVEGSVQHGTHGSARVSWRRDLADLPGGSFRADVTALRLGWAFSTRLVAGAYVQYNSLEKRWVTNLRLVLTHRPGSDLFVVYNEERGSEATPQAIVNRTLVVKLTWLLRF